jgi:Ca2+:H+ antiporter
MSESEQHRKPRQRMTNQTINASSIGLSSSVDDDNVAANNMDALKSPRGGGGGGQQRRLSQDRPSPRDWDSEGIKSGSQHVPAFRGRLGFMRHLMVGLKSMLDVRERGDGDHHAHNNDRNGLPSYQENFKTVVFGTKLNVLLLFAPLGVLCNMFHLGDGPAFAFALLALCPLAERLGFVTEEMAKHTSQTIGGLLNATFGNATEMIVSVFALRDGLLRVVQLSLVGSIFSNMLLVLGCAFFAGGVKWPEQRFNKNGAMTNSSLLCLAVMGVTLPNALHATHTELRGTVSELALSRFSATLLLIMYVVFLYFQLVSHTDFFEDEPVEKESNNNSSSFISNSKKDDDDNNNNEIEEDEDSDDEDEDPELGFTESIYYMAAITLLISILSDVIVATIEGAARSWNCPVAFISVVMLPIVGNAAEHASAVMFALRNKMDISIGVAIGSSTQIAMFVFPFCVCVAWAMNKPLDLNMKVFETVSLVLCVVTVTFCIRDGKGNWLKGLTLILAYVILAASFFFHAEPPAEGLAGTSRFRIDG